PARPLDDLVGDPGESPVDPRLVEHLGLLALAHGATPDIKTPSPSSGKGLVIAAVVIASPCGPRRAHLKELPYRTLRRAAVSVKRSDVLGRIRPRGKGEVPALVREFADVGLDQGREHGPTLRRIAHEISSGSRERGMENDDVVPPVAMRQHGERWYAGQ